MKKALKRWCVRVGLWIAGLGGYQPRPAPAPDPVHVLAATLTKRQNDNWPERDGECKRAAVYAQLTNTFPQTSKRAISQAIEEALSCGAS